MKTVYVDVVFIFNFCIDYLLMYITSCFLNIKTSFIRKAASAAFGGAYAVFMSLVFCLPVFRIISLVLSLIVMSLIAFGKRHLQTYIKIFISLLSFSVLLGGFVTLCLSNSGNTAFKALPMVVCAVIFLFAVLQAMKLLRVEIFSKKVTVRIDYADQSAEAVLLCDSGNMLEDPYNGLPVILLDSKYKEVFVENCENQICKSSIRLIPLKTVGGISFVSTITPDAVYVVSKGSILVNASVGFVSGDCFSKNDYDGIIPCSIINNL